ncbi:hypothetical protein DMA11_20365 [Marinilabiliaceae bacterium JC017]|nr:hypothetical protein DMA11_20365 [Marinilabiliaceae bacterium JC017]
MLNGRFDLKSTRHDKNYPVWLLVPPNQPPLLEKKEGKVERVRVFVGFSTLRLGLEISDKQKTQKPKTVAEISPPESFRRVIFIGYSIIIGEACENRGITLRSQYDLFRSVYYSFRSRITLFRSRVESFRSFDEVLRYSKIGEPWRAEGALMC